jgi:hypothetical protein
MFLKCRCLECETPLKVLFDFRYAEEKKIELYAIEDDGKDPIPTGYCVECVKDAVAKDLSLIASKLDDEKVSFVDFRRRNAERYLAATGTA